MPGNASLCIPGSHIYFSLRSRIAEAGIPINSKIAPAININEMAYKPLLMLPVVDLTQPIMTGLANPPVKPRLLMKAMLPAAAAVPTKYAEEIDQKSGKSE